MSTAGSGRSIPNPGFAADDGAADPDLVAALTAYDAGRVCERDVLAALAAARLLVPVVAVLGESETGSDGLRRDKTADMALPTLVGKDGRRALPAFTSTAALAAWDSTARPVPVGSQRAALSALGEGCELLVIDIAGLHRHVVEGARLRSLAAGNLHRPAHEDPEVRSAVTSAVAGLDGVRGWQLTAAPAAGAESLLTLELDASLDAAAMRSVVVAVGKRLQDDTVMRARLGSAIGIAGVPGES